MPPRNRKPKEETVTEETHATSATNTAVDVKEPKGTRDTTPVQLTTGFLRVSKDDVPNRVRVRSRNNPFDEIMAEIWDARLDEQGDYVQVGVDNVKRAIRQLVSAGQFLNCGVTIIVDTAEGTSDRGFKGPGDLWFHARPKRGAEDDVPESDDDDSDE